MSGIAVREERRIKSRGQRHLRRLIAIGLVMASAFGLVSSPVEAGAQTDRRSWVYDLVIEGQAGDRTFRRTAVLVVHDTISSVGTTNGVNPLDICLYSGSPAARPEVGAITFGSNSGCVNSRGARIDMAHVQWTTQGLEVRPDGQVAAIGANVFTISDNYLLACPYMPSDGSAIFNFGQDGSLNGAIDIVGRGCFATPSRYQANVSGTLRR